MKRFFEAAKALNCHVLPQQPLRQYTTLKIGGPCLALVDIDHYESLIQLKQVADNENIPYVFVGRGSNLLVDDAGFDGIVFMFGSRFSRVDVDSARENRYLHAQAGAPLAKVCWNAYKNNLSGLEFAWGIPGSLGGALYMNAGAYDGEMSLVVKNTTVISHDGSLKVVNLEDMDLKYRYSRFQNSNEIILDVVLELTESNPVSIRNKMDSFMLARKTKQPLEYPSAGSFFKRPKGFFAGKLIEDAGMRGFRVGDAQISPKHAGFLVNLGNASSADVLLLVEKVREAVMKNAGVYLKCEPRFLSKNGWIKEI